MKVSTGAQCVVLVLVFELAASCADATLGKPMVTPSGDGIDARYELTFKRALKAGNEREVSVTFESEALEAPVSFDWAYIAANDQKVVVTYGVAGELETFVPNEATTPQSAPPIGTPLVVTFRMRSKASFVSSGQPTLKATLSWGGVKQDDVSRGLFLSYQRK